MADRIMCLNDNCPAALTCRRRRDTPKPMQMYNTFEPYEKDGRMHCDFYVPVEKLWTWEKGMQLRYAMPDPFHYDVKSVDTFQPRQCAVVVDSTGEHCPGEGKLRTYSVHPSDADAPTRTDYLCDSCFYTIEIRNRLVTTPKPNSIFTSWYSQE